MENPFKQFLPEEEPPKQAIEEEVMANIHLKSYLGNILEFFIAIFGITIQESVAPVSDTRKKPRRAKDDEPDFFF